MKFLNFIKSKWFTYLFPGLFFILMALFPFKEVMGITFFSSIGLIIWILKIAVDTQIKELK